MQTEDKRACAACGAANRTDTVSCWQCLAPLDASMPPAPGAPAGSSPASFGPPIAPPPVASVGGGTSKAARIVVGLLAAFLGYIGVQQLLGGGGVEIPDTVAGVARMHGGVASRFEAEMAAEVDRYGMDAEAGVFGNGGAPAFLLMVVNGSTPESTDEMFDSFVQGMTQGGASVGAVQGAGELDGASYRCVGAEAGGAGVGVCMWRADDHVGIVFDLAGDSGSTETLMRSAYDDVAG